MNDLPNILIAQGKFMSRHGSSFGPIFNNPKQLAIWQRLHCIFTGKISRCRFQPPCQTSIPIASNTVTHFTGSRFCFHLIKRFSSLNIFCSSKQRVLFEGVPWWRFFSFARLRANARNDNQISRILIFWRQMTSQITQLLICRNLCRWKYKNRDHKYREKKLHSLSPSNSITFLKTVSRKAGSKISKSFLMGGEHRLNWYNTKKLP